MKNRFPQQRIRMIAARAPDIGLMLAISFPMLVLVVFLIGLLTALGRANATETGTCASESLVSTLSDSHPERLAEARKLAGSVVNGHGLLWKIEKAGLEPSWLFGTMHVTDPRVTELPVPARQALDAASTVVIETTDVLDPEKAQAALLGRPELTMFTDGSSIETLLEGDDFKLVEEGLSRRGIPLTLVSRMKPWIITSLIALPDCELHRKSTGVDFLDKRIALEARAAGKEVLGLETADEQLSAMASLPMEFHLRGLVETIRLADLMPSIMATMTELYLSGDIAMIMPVIQAALPYENPDDAEGYVEFEEKIIRLRNHVMAERAEPILAGGNAFIAVGAMHLPGKEGVVELLRNSGYTVTAAAN